MTTHAEAQQAFDTAYATAYALLALQLSALAQNPLALAKLDNEQCQTVAFLCEELIRVLREKQERKAREMNQRVGGRVPEIGLDVHYVAYGTPGGEYAPGAHRAAKISEFDARDTPIMSVGLVIFNPTGLFFTRGVLFDETGTQPGTWHWPETPAG